MISQNQRPISRAVKLWTVTLQNYSTAKNIDYVYLGKELDQIIQQNFLGKTIVIRLIGSQDHDKNIPELVHIIQKIGTDRYNPYRKMMFHDFYAKHKPDLFGSVFTVSNKSPSMCQLLKEFHTKTLADRNKGVTADIILLYDPRKLNMIHQVYDGQTESDCFTFKDPKQKQKALLGIIQVVPQRVSNSR